MKTALNLALLSIILSISSMPIGLITGKTELFATITLIFMYIGLIFGLAAWYLLIISYKAQSFLLQRLYEHILYMYCSLLFRQHGHHSLLPRTDMPFPLLHILPVQTDLFCLTILLLNEVKTIYISLRAILLRLRLNRTLYLI